MNIPPSVICRLATGATETVGGGGALCPIAPVQQMIRKNTASLPVITKILIALSVEEY
jgi:hypothetical protein